jgi:S1-C subfamily serine protease
MGAPEADDEEDDLQHRVNGYAFADMALPTAPEIADAARPKPRDFPFDLDRVLGSVVGIHAQVPPEAFTASVLGTTRQGQGVVIDEAGLVLTIGYLITEAERVRVAVGPGQIMPAEVLAYDFESGFGLVRTESRIGRPALAIGDSASLGERQLAIVGARGGIRHALRVRVVGRREFAGYWEYLLERAIFTFPAHPTWSGSALIGANGTLLGIGSLYVQDAVRGAAERPGNMFVPIDLLPPILDDLLAHGRPAKPPRPWLGIYVAEAEGRLVIGGVARGGPADRAGIGVGDQILAVGDTPAATLADLWKQVWRQGEAGVEVAVMIGREGRVFRVSIKSIARHRFLRPIRRTRGDS